MIHCNQRGSEAIVGKWSHVFRYEQGSPSYLANVFINALDNFEDGTFSIDELKDAIRGSDIHQPTTQLVVVEQTHNMTGLFVSRFVSTSEVLLIAFVFSTTRWKSRSVGVDRRSLKSL